jgi:dipeptidyl aminopeptidase/acylaminoacyl peptidase
MNLQRDIRETPLYRQARTVFETVHAPGSGQISDAADVHASADGRNVVFAGTLLDELRGIPQTRICITNLVTGKTRVLTFGPNVDRSPRFSPDGHRVAFLSDRLGAGDFQLYLLDPSSGAVRPTPRVAGWVEYLHWSADGRRDAGDEAYQWRRAWVYELAANTVRELRRAGCNIWEAVWCANESIAAIASSSPKEGSWYSASLQLIEIESLASRTIHEPRGQLGCLASAPSGGTLAFVEGVCSDRGAVAGDLHTIELASGVARKADTRDVDVTHAEWCAEDRILVAGQRSFESVVGLYDTKQSAFGQVWSSNEISTGGSAVTASSLNGKGDCVLVGESFTRSPEIAVIRDGQYQPIRSFELGYARLAEALGAVDRITWAAPDGLEIQGWLLRPRADGPHPLVMHVHGGPVAHWRPVWLARANVTILMLIQKQYAVFLPNPRGSSGRGQELTRRVLGDMAGADTYDLLSGIDELVKRGIADRNRLGALDRCTPPEEAAQFHNALCENGVRSVLVTYPEEGHGVRKFPALIDYTARVIGWFEENLGAARGVK